MSDLISTKLGPCSKCGDYLKPCRCLLEARIGELEADRASETKRARLYLKAFSKLRDAATKSLAETTIPHLAYLKQALRDTEGV